MILGCLQECFYWEEKTELFIPDLHLSGKEFPLFVQLGRFLQASFGGLRKEKVAHNPVSREDRVLQHCSTVDVFFARCGVVPDTLRGSGGGGSIGSLVGSRVLVSILVGSAKLALASTAQTSGKPDEKRTPSSIPVNLPVNLLRRAPLEEPFGNHVQSRSVIGIERHRLVCAINDEERQPHVPLYLRGARPQEEPVRLKSPYGQPVGVNVVSGNERTVFRPYDGRHQVAITPGERNAPDALLAVTIAPTVFAIEGAVLEDQGELEGTGTGLGGLIKFQTEAVAGDIPRDCTLFVAVGSELAGDSFSFCCQLETRVAGEYAVSVLPNPGSIQVGFLCEGGEPQRDQQKREPTDPSHRSSQKVNARRTTAGSIRRCGALAIPNIPGPATSTQLLHANI